MKKQSIFLAFALLTACGSGGGSEGLDLSESPINTSFAGTYQFKDDDCSGRAAVQRFTINLANDELTDHSNGDIYPLESVREDGQDGLYSEDADCVIFFIRNDEDLIEAATYAPGVDFEIGDLSGICSDSSSDNLCSLSYTRI